MRAVPSCRGRPARGRPSSCGRRGPSRVAETGLQALKVARAGAAARPWPEPIAGEALSEPRSPDTQLPPGRGRESGGCRPWDSTSIKRHCDVCVDSGTRARLGGARLLVGPDLGPTALMMIIAAQDEPASCRQDVQRRSTPVFRAVAHPSTTAERQDGRAEATCGTARSPLARRPLPNSNWWIIYVIHQTSLDQLEVGTADVGVHASTHLSFPGPVPAQLSRDRSARSPPPA